MGGLGRKRKGREKWEEEREREEEGELVREEGEVGGRKKWRKEERRVERMTAMVVVSMKVDRSGEGLRRKGWMGTDETGSGEGTIWWPRERENDQEKSG